MSQILSAAEAAKVLGVSAWTIRQWSSQRKLRFYKVGRLTKYKASDLEAFLERGKVEANPAA
jgi:excisionase family DNA binding protein